MTMTTFTSVLLVFSSLLMSVLSCQWMERYRHLNNQSLSLIQHMGGPITNEESPVPFPYHLYKSMRAAEPETKMIFIREGLRMILELYSNCSSEVWDADKTEHFVTIIDRQVAELNHCVPVEKRNRLLRKYFRRLRNRTLRHHGYSADSWELIRSDTKYHLRKLQLLAASIPTSSQSHHLHPTASATTQLN